MTLDELIVIANDGYNTNGRAADTVLAYHRKPNGKHGDSIAKFIAGELRDTFDEDAGTNKQLAYAIKKLEEAQADIESVIQQLSDYRATYCADDKGDA